MEEHFAMMNPLRLLTALAALIISGCATTPAPVVPVVPEVPVVPVAVIVSAAPAAPAAVQAPAPVPPEPVAALPSTAMVEAPAEELPVAAIDPLRPHVRIDPNDESARSDLWERARQGFRMAELDNPLVRKWEQYYASRPDYLQRMFERGARYLFHIVDELERRNLPSDLALLPFIESAFNPQAMSSAKASGMWQFVPATGRDFSLKQNIFRDDRRDVLASTRAALDYLQKLHGMFNDWQLALAAYNWGQGSVQRAIARKPQAGLAGGYEQLSMPDETRNYLPKLQAIKNIVARPEAFGVTLPALQNHPYFLAVRIERDIDVDLAARLAGLPMDEFKQLNPQMNKPVILAAGTPQLLLPYDAANAFVRALPKHKGMLATWTAWVAPKTLRLAEVAQQLGMSEAQLREVNHIPPRMKVMAGSTLLVRRHSQLGQDVTEHIADHAVLSLAQEAPALRRASFTVGKRGSTLVALARQYKVSAVQLAQWNGVAVNASFKAGHAVLVMLPNKRAAVASKAPPGRRVAAAPQAAQETRQRPVVSLRPVRGATKLATSSAARRIAKPGPPARHRD